MGGARTDIGDPLLQLRIRRHANQEHELSVRGPQPEGGDEAGEDDGAHGVDPPVEMTARERGEDTDAVDEHIVAVVFPEDADLRVRIT